MRKAENLIGDRDERRNQQFQAVKEFENSLDLRKALPGESVARADEVFTLLQLGNAWKKISGCIRQSVSWRWHITSENAMEKAQLFYEEALKLSQNVFGEHELTSTCFKNFGDLFLTTKRYEAAESNYKFAGEMQENLDLHASKSHAYLLKNFGTCLKEIEQ